MEKVGPSQAEPGTRHDRPALRSGALARVGRGAAGPLVAALLSIAAMAQALKVWEWRPGTPLGLTGDGPWMATLVRGYIEHGPYGDNPLFGAPFVLNTGWSSTGNDLHVWILSALGQVWSDPFTVMALYFFATFPLSAMTMYWLCRKYGVAKPAAVMAGVLFSVLPGHQERFPHLFLAAYWAVPFAAWLIIETAAGRSVLGNRHHTGAAHVGGGRLDRRRWVTAVLLPVLMLLAIGLGDVYYVAFTLLIAAPIIVLRQLRGPSLRELGVLVLPLVVMLAPTLVSIGLARARADRDVLTGGMPFGRTFLDSDRWAGQIVDLVLPWPGHRLAALGDRTQAYDALTRTTGEVSSIGFVALVGLLAVLVLTALALIRGRAGSLDPLVVALAIASLIAVAFYTRGGLGALTALFVTPQIRTWSRLFLFIALFGLLAVAWLVTKLSRLRDGRRHVVAVSLVALVLGVLDQTNPERAPAYAANRQALATYAAFDDRVEQALGPGCSVFVLPVVGFPEVNDDLWQDLMSLGLASNGVRWSFGAIKGTAQADWQLGLSTVDATDVADDLASLDFCGIVVERSLSERAPLLASALPRLLGEPVATSGDQRFVAFDLRPQRRALEAALGPAGIRERAVDVLYPVIASLSGAWAVDDVDGRRYPLGPGPSIALTNMSTAPARVTLDLELVGAASGDTNLRLEGLGARSEAVVLGPRQRGRTSLTVDVPAGTSSIALTRSGQAVGWEAYSEPAALASVLSMTVETDDPAVNVGVDLPTP